MNADLEETLRELGEPYRPVVDRLRAAAEVEVPPRADRERLSAHGWRLPRLLAACLAVACLSAGLLVFLSRGTADVRSAVAAEEAGPALSPYALAYSQTPQALAEIVRTQAPDGSWANDFLTRQNAAALAGIATERVAYRRAVRYLRQKGLAPFSEAELARHRAGAI